MDPDRSRRITPPGNRRAPDGGISAAPSPGGEPGSESNASEHHDSVPTRPVRDEDTGSYTVRYDWSDVTPSTAIIEAVSTVVDADPVEIDPLRDVADPDAIDKLLDTAGDAAGDLEVTFRYESVHVSARRDGTITLRSVEDEKPE